MMTPSPSLLGRSAYTVFGCVGYGVAVTIATILTIVWDFTLSERLVVMFTPPLAFIIVTAIATALKGREWIVFYQTAAAAVAATQLVGFAVGARLLRLADVVVLGIGCFLMLGRIGCFHVACCHGRPARHGVRYDDRHVSRGLWSACADRPLWPVQLIEAGVTALTVVGALFVAATPGCAALVFAVCYAVFRYFLEFLRGDPIRPMFLAISEAQWWSLAIAIGCAVVRPTGWSVTAALILGAVTFVLALIHERRELVAPCHVRELEAVCAQVFVDPTHSRRETTLGLAVSCHALPNSRLDWVWSSTRPAWSIAVAKRLVKYLWPQAELVAGRTPGVVHVVVPLRD